MPPIRRSWLLLAALMSSCAPDGELDLEPAGDADGKADGPAGALIAPPAEACGMTGLDPGFVAPHPGLSVAEGLSRARLIPPLRAAARTRDARSILVRAVAEQLRGSTATAQALADLAVTGRAAYQSFRRLAPTDASLLAAARAGGVDAGDGELHAAVAVVLDRSYRVAWALRGPTAHRLAARRALGWIAVSSEEDPPHRPVNVPSAPYPQVDLDLSPGGLAVTVRTLVASGWDDLDAGPAFEPRAVPPEVWPAIPPEDALIVYIPGHGSRVEEALDLIPHLHGAASSRGRDVTVISFDAPGFGYSSRVEHTRIAPAEASRHNVSYPVLDFLEESVVALVAELERQQPGASSRVLAVVGGSLGGNLTLRLARRDPARFPWLANAVAWSPVSIWESWGPARVIPTAPGEYFDAIKYQAVTISRQRMVETEDESRRADFLDQVFGPPIHGAEPVSQRWYRAGWEPCKGLLIEGATRFQDEIYGPELRRLHWRAAHEVLLFSHRDPDPGGDRPRYATVRARLLLAAGAADDAFPEFLFSRAREVAAAMPSARTLFLADTGHSIHNERPRFLARRIVDFLVPR
jgi:alpha-beta hydrolase superfamily lysophospholipase